VVHVTRMSTLTLSSSDALEGPFMLRYTKNAKAYWKEATTAFLNTNMEDTGETKYYRVRDDSNGAVYTVFKSATYKPVVTHIMKSKKDDISNLASKMGRMITDEADEPKEADLVLPLDDSVNRMTTDIEALASNHANVHFNVTEAAKLSKFMITTDVVTKINIMYLSDIRQFIVFDALCFAIFQDDHMTQQSDTRIDAFLNQLKTQRHATLNERSYVRYIHNNSEADQMIFYANCLHCVLLKSRVDLEIIKSAFTDYVPRVYGKEYLPPMDLTTLSQDLDLPFDDFMNKVGLNEDLSVYCTKNNNFFSE
jgi:hypothetical protein